MTVRASPSCGQWVMQKKEIVLEYDDNNRETLRSPPQGLFPLNPVRQELAPQFHVGESRCSKEVFTERRSDVRTWKMLVGYLQLSITLTGRLLNLRTLSFHPPLLAFSMMASCKSTS
eukprot:scaffold22604_cov130-Cylindrotheca_fusiformis.AAC.5